MRRALLVSLAVVFAFACGDNITEPLPDRTKSVTPPVSFATTTTEDGLSISTDKDDYQPGDTVHFTGSGWQPGDTLDIVLTDDPLTHDPHTWTVTVSEDGTFHDSTYVVDEGDLDVTFTLEATSRLTGRSLTVQFTDSQLNANAVTVSPASATVSPGNSASYTVTIAFGGNSQVCTVTLGTTALPTGAAATFNPASVSGANGDSPTSSLTVTTTATGVNATPPGTYTFSVTATIGATGCQGVNRSSDPVTLIVQAPGNQAPSVDAGGPYSGAEGAALALNGTASDPDGDALIRTWTISTTGIDAGGTCSFSDDTAEDPTVTCTDDSNGGTFTLTLTVDDGKGHVVSDNATLTVTNANPTANAGGGTTGYSGSEGGAVSLTGAKSDPGSNDTHTYLWTYAAVSGVDAGATCSFSPSATALTTSISCTDDGIFKVTLTVTDDDGGSKSGDANLELTNEGPVADAGGGANGYSGNEGSPVQLQGSATDAGSNDTFTWSWAYVGVNVDPGATCSFSDANAKEPTVTCTDDGTVKLTLTVTDDDGSSNSDDATLTLANVNPVADAGGGTAGYSGSEGSAVSLTGSKTDAGSNDTHTYLWTYTAVSGVDGGATCHFSDATALSPTIACTDDGVFKVTLKVTDDDGGEGTDDATLTLSNANPVANAGGSYSGNEGASVSLTGSKTDAGSNDTHTYVWTYAAVSGVDAGATCSFSSATVLNPTITCTDDGSYKVTLTVTDDDGGVGTNDANLSLSNVNPVLSAITAPLDPVNISSPVLVSATFTDQGTNDTHTGTINWGDGNTSPAAITEANGSGSASGSHLYGSPGVYTITMTLYDDDGGTVQSVYQYVVVYDPAAGFVTGGGWVNSPYGAYPADPNLTGKANFGFVSKYQKGATIPTGNTEFQFHAGNLNFKSTSYEWLVVQGSTRASYKGEGIINGGGSYGFLLSVVDGGSSGDKFRIKIWNKATSTVVYDNQMSATDDATASQLIAGGSIVIHTNGGVASK